MNEFIGAELDLAVANAMGGVFRVSKPWEAWDDGERIRTCLFVGDERQSIEEWQPSTDWSQGGPIIERERIMLIPSGDEWSASVGMTAHPMCGDPIPDETGREGSGHGPTPLIAAMRAFVASRQK